MESILKKYGWHEFLCKSHYSFLRGASSPLALLQTAFSHQYSSLALNDFNGCYGLARFHLEDRHDQCKKIYGCEINLAADHDRPLLQQHTLVLLALNLQGYHQLCSIASRTHQRGKSDAYLGLSEFQAADCTQLVAIQPMRGIMRSRGKEAELHLRQHLDHLKTLFPDRFYLAVSRHLHAEEDYWIPRTLLLSRELNIPCLLSQDAFFHQASTKDLHDLLQAIRLNQVLDKAVWQMFPNAERHLKDLKQLARIYGSLPIFEQALRTGKALSERFQFCLSELKYQYPQEMIPSGYNSQGFLEKITWEGAQSFYPQGIPEKIHASLESELRLIEQLQFADYFLTVWDIVSWARQQDILCQGRGSAANSAVCFVLGITSVNPARFDLLFERFISMERGDPPDIDVDFEHERREEVIQYIYRRYGRERAAMVANVIVYRRRGALRAVGKALGISPKIIDQVSKQLGSKIHRGKALKDILPVIRQEIQEQLPNEADIPWELWLQYTRKLRKTPRHLGIHSGGFIVSHQPLNHLIPQEPATMEGRTVVQWCKDDIEGMGLFKIDILALGMLTALRKCFQLLQQHGQVDLALHRIPEDDPETYEMIQKADTVGTFQIESRAQMSMLPRLKPKTFYDLVIQIAIIRPGPIQGGMIAPFLKRRAGLEPVRYPAEKLRPILERTLGIPIFQEQVMRIAMAVGDFNGGEADLLRKHIGSWNIKFDRHLNPLLQRLSAGMRRNGIAEHFIEEILQQLKGFAHYGFPESHSLSFALLAYASSYLKLHYPAHFFAAVLNSQPMGFYAPHALLQAAQRQNVTVLPVCIQHSTWDQALEPSPDLKAKPFAIRLGFRLVKDLSQATAERICLARQACPQGWQSLAHLLSRVQIYRDELTALAAADVFKSLGLSRREALWWAEKVPIAPTLDAEEPAFQWPEEGEWIRTRLDFQSFQTSLGAHPTELIKRDHWYYPIPQKSLVTAQELALQKDGTTVNTFGMILSRQAPPTAKGVVFATLEDAFGMINLVFMPDIYQKFHANIDSQAFLCLRGVLQRNGSSHSILVKEVFSYDRRLFLTHTLSFSDPKPGKQGKNEKPMKPLSAEASVETPLFASRDYH